MEVNLCVIRLQIKR